MFEIEVVNQIKSRLVDKESEEIFSIRLGEVMQNNWGGNYFVDYLCNRCDEYRLSDYDDFRDLCKEKPIIIRGAGIAGKMTYLLLQTMGIDIEMFCDNDVEKQRNGYLNKPVISESELIAEYKDRFVIIASMYQGASFYGKLISQSFPRENLFLPRIGSLYATRGWQYFDCEYIMPERGEVFVDCGCFDGGTSADFIRWCNGEYDSIIAFEPDKFSNANIKQNCKYDRFTLYPYATGAKREEVCFNAASDGGSRIDTKGSEVVTVESIDNILDGRKATYIKLDVEGAELDTLKGAQKTIINYKPRLAISIYHKPLDMIEIPKYVMELRDDYKFCIRHYTNCRWETILYAF